jgi:DNA-directed RNA polymerase specialized sigma24 family protein
MITSPIDRDIILLRGRDLSFSVIAEMMQMEPSAVRMRWSRIRQRVRGVFDEDSSL